MPPTLLRLLQSERGPSREDGVETFEAAVLFADISGWSTIVRELSAEGPSGVERLALQLNAYFGRLIEVIHLHGGSVEKFAGDALIATWRGDGDPAGAVRRAVSCGLELIGPDDAGVSDGSGLELHVGVAAGTVRALLGSVTSARGCFVLGGPPVAEVGEAAARAGRTGLVVTGEAFALLTGSDDPTPGFHAITTDDSPRPDPAAPPAADDFTNSDPDAVSRFLHPVLAGRTRGGTTADWLSEMRRVTALFAQVDLHPDPGADPAPERIVAAARVLHRVADRFEGAVHDFLLDDKGLVGILLFGAARTHEDDAERAVRAGMELLTELEALGMSGRAGVSTGRAFTGVIGTAGRRQFAVVGDPMNQAARLMTAADTVLCDQATRSLSEARLGFEPVAGVRMKGRSADAEVFLPSRGAGTAPRRAARMVGREGELGQLSEVLDAHTRSGGFRLAIVEGEAGIGKSTLVRHLEARAAERGFRIRTAEADPIASRRAFDAWGPPLRGILTERGAGSLADGLAELVERRTDLLGRLPLLNPILDVQLDESEFTRRLDGEARGEATVELILTLLDDGFSGDPCLLVCEDAHWLDASSWDVLRGLARRGTEVVVLATTRPVTGHASEALRSLAERAQTRIALGELSAESVREVVASAAGAEEASARVGEFVFSRTRGHPLFAEEMTRAMVEQGLLTDTGGICDFSEGALDTAAEGVPDTLERVILSRVDRLEETDRLLVKVASVIGLAFGSAELLAVVPSEVDPGDLDPRLTRLEHAGLLSPVDAGTERYEFRHAVIRDVGYELMTGAQRRLLHRRFAEWLESDAATSPTGAATLAHHWKGAGDLERGIHYAESAGLEALRVNANREAARLLGDAVEMDDRAGRTATPDRRAAWRTGLGKACRYLGRVPEARESLEAALEELGRPVPSGGLRTVASVVTKLVRHVAGSRGLDAAPDPEPDRTAVALVETHLLLGLLAYYENETLTSMYANFAGLDHARAAGASFEAAQIYGAVANLLGFMALRPTARRFGERAHRVAEASGNPLAIGSVHQYTGHLAACMGDLETFEHDMKVAAEFYEDYGQWRLLEEALVNQSYLYLFRGRLDDALRVSLALENSGYRRDDRQTLAWSVLAQARVSLHRGDAERAVELADRAIASLKDRLSLIDGHGYRALAHWRAGNASAAWSDVERTVSLIEENPVPFYTALPGFSAAAEAAVEIWMHGDASGAAARQAVRRICSGLSALARASPIAVPRAGLWAGVHAWLSGRKRTARRRWRRASQAAERMGLVVDQAQIDLWIVRLDPDHDPMDEARRRALAVYSQLQFPWEVGLLRSTDSPPTSLPSDD